MTMTQARPQGASDTPLSHAEASRLGQGSECRTIRVEAASQTVTCPPGASVLDAFERARNPLLAMGNEVVRVGCRRGGCGICKVRIVEGKFRASHMSRAHVTEGDQADGLVLACCVFPESDLVVASVPVCPRSLKNS